LPELEYIFKHDLTREAAYNGLLKRDRRLYHRQVAEALARLFPDRVEEMLGLLAHHWERAGDAEKATHYLLQAGDQARLAHAHQEAADYYQRALVLLESMAEYDRAARTQMKLGLVYNSAFDFRSARQAYEAGFALWQRAASAQPTVSPPPAPHALRMFGDRPAGLDPGLGMNCIIDQLFSGLVAHTPELGIVPDVAARWEVFDGGRRYLFHLRDDVLWSDGVPVTAHDFQYAWQRVLDPATGWENASRMLYDIEGARAFHEAQSRDLCVQALDDATLSVELEGPTGYLFHLLGSSFTYPIPRHVVERVGSGWTDPERIVTNGPFTLADWQPEQSLVLERYQQYHGIAAGNLDRVEFSFLQAEDRSAPVRSYQGGLSDVLELPGEQSIETMDLLRRLYASEWVPLPHAITGLLAFDTAHPPFDDARVRKAFALALDRETLMGVVWGAYWLPATGGFVPPGMPGHVPGIAPPYDPEQGRQLLAEAGYPGGAGFPAVEIYFNLPPEPEACDPLVVMWNDNLHLERPVRWGSMGWDEYKDRLRSNAPPHIYFSGWAADYPDPDSFLRVGLQAFSIWEDDRYLEIIERARRMLNQAERMELYAQAEGILAEEMPILPLDYGPRHHLIKPWVRRYPRSVAGRLFWQDVIIEPH
jgi:oligopeptide transport system substrate-binding protein